MHSFLQTLEAVFHWAKIRMFILGKVYPESTDEIIIILI